MAYYPLCLEMTERRCLVVGGGPVAERKVAGLLDAGARLTVVSPAATDRLRHWAESARLRMLLREYMAGDLAGHTVVFVATDDGCVNARVARDARAAGVLINAADDPAHCDAIIPAIVRRGDVTVAVSTGGASPALARAVREHLERALPPAYGTLLQIAGDARRALRATARRASADDWLAALDAGLQALLDGAPAAEAERRLRARLEAVA